jgi:hypothetical protein
LLKEYKDCFAWDYTEMPGLDRSIVEHQLPIKSGFRPHQQPARRCNPNILPDIKAEITKLIEARFIRQCRYAEWISNVVPVYKKNRKLCVCIDFRNLNKATPMDGYSMPIADLLIHAAAGLKLSASWMVMRVIIKYSWLKRIFPRLLLGVKVMWDYLNG